MDYNPYAQSGVNMFPNQATVRTSPWVFNQAPQLPQQLIKVTGIDGAKAYQMPPNSTVALFDADNDIFYVKSTDGAGFPTIRAFSFTPIEEKPQPDVRQFVTRDEFNQTLMNIQEMISNAQQPVPAEPVAKPSSSRKPARSTQSD